MISPVMWKPVERFARGMSRLREMMYLGLFDRSLIRWRRVSNVGLERMAEVGTLWKYLCVVKSLGVDDLNFRQAIMMIMCVFGLVRNRLFVVLVGAYSTGLMFHVIKLSLYFFLNVKRSIAM